MVNFCAVIGCSNRADGDRNKSFFRLPFVIAYQEPSTEKLSSRRQREWFAAIKRNIKKSNYSFTQVCLDHFITGSPSTLYDSENPDLVPTLHLGYDEVDTTCSMQQALCCFRAQDRAHSKHRRLDHDAEADVDHNDTSTTTISLESPRAARNVRELLMSDLKQHRLQIRKLIMTPL
uniref:THAP-type domain-containing protein n=1 Tax=Amphimedon queenslandica TaxID=400682 RepID=A0A1X7UCY6_AMPQE